MSLARQEEVALENLLREIVGQAPVELPPRRPDALRPDATGKILNPATGKYVLATGRAGKAVIAAHAAALVDLGVNMPRGAVPRAAAAVGPIEPGPVTRAGVNRMVGAYRAQQWLPARPASTLAEFAKQISVVASKVPGYRQTVIIFHDREDYRIRRTIHGSSIPHIISELERLQEGKQGPAGSDMINEGYVLDTSVFEIGSVIVPAGGHYKFTGVSKAAGRSHPHFKLMDFSGKAAPGDCLLAVLRAVGRAAGSPVPKQRNENVRAMCGIPPGNIAATDANMSALGELFQLRIRVVIAMTVPPDHCREYDDDRHRDDQHRCATYAEPVVIASGGNSWYPACDVYLDAEHYEYIAHYLAVRTCPITGDIISADKPPTLKETRRRVLEQGRRWWGTPKEAPAKVRACELRTRIIVYDYETVYTPSGVLEPYALGYIVYNPYDQLKPGEPGHGDFSVHSPHVVQIIRRPGESAFSVTAPLLDLIAAAEPDIAYTLVSFNGARFDHFILAAAAHQRGCLKSVFATPGGGLRSVSIGRHKTLDLAKLLPAMSLADACKGFQTQPRKVEGFSHKVVQAAYDEGRLYDWLAANREQLMEYLDGDVLSTASLCVKATTAITALSGKSCYGQIAVGTIGGHAWARMSDACSLPKPVREHKLDLIIRSAIVGGRVQVYGERVIDEGEQLRMVDFASLYPTAMSAAEKAASVFAPEEMWGVYPSGGASGEPEHVAEWVDGVVGLYRCTIHEQPPNKPNVLPRRIEGEPLDWAYRGEFETWATHIDIHLIRRGGGSCTIHEGYVWRNSHRGLFKPFIKPLAAAKDEQDRLMDANDPDANPALRMALKLLMNSASGKCCQNNYDDEVVLATGSAAQLAAELKMDQDKPRTWIPLGGETCIIVGKKPGDRIYKKSAKPSILAVLIYANSRALVWRTLCQHNVLYSDTDSGLFRMKDYEALRKAFPQLDPTGRHKELGDLEQELPDHVTAEAYLLAPKDYAVICRDKDGKASSKSKMRIKGVCLARDYHVTDPALAEFISKAPLPEQTAAYNMEPPEPSQRLRPTENVVAVMEARAASQVDPMERLLFGSPIEAYYTPQLADGEPKGLARLSDTENMVAFMKARAAGETATVLTSQIERSYRDEQTPFSLRQRFMIKKL
jgi:hypothetical protein